MEDIPQPSTSITDCRFRLVAQIMKKTWKPSAKAVIQESMRNSVTDLERKIPDPGGLEILKRTLNPNGARVSRIKIRFQSPN